MNKNIHSFFGGKNMIEEKELNMIKNIYKKGKKIKLISMQDDYPVPSGSMGIVDFIDDAGQIHVNWNNGSSLALIYGVDKFEIIKNKERER